MSDIQDFVTSIMDNVEKVIVGKRPAIEMLMVAMLCEGHVLLEDVPGVGKTMLARSLAISLRGQFNRLPKDAVETLLGTLRRRGAVVFNLPRRASRSACRSGERA